jgi:hypothetical protein
VRRYRGLGGRAVRHDERNPKRQVAAPDLEPTDLGVLPEGQWALGEQPATLGVNPIGRILGAGRLPVR